MSRSSKSRPSTTRRKKQHLKVVENDTQLDFDAPLSDSALSQDLRGQAELAMQQIEEMRKRQLELARHREQLEEIDLQKQEFLSSQGELSDKLTGAISLIEREVFEMKQEIEDLQHTRDNFALHLEKIEALDFHSWKREELAPRLSSALSIIDHAEDDFEEAVDLFRGSRSDIFGSGKRRRALASRSSSSSTGPSQFAAGLAFHSPLLLLALVAIVIYVIS